MDKQIIYLCTIPTPNIVRVNVAEKAISHRSVLRFYFPKPVIMGMATQYFADRHKIILAGL